MKHTLIFSDKAVALQAMSPSAGPSANRKKNMSNRFPSSQRMQNYSPNKQQQYAAQVATYTNS